MLWSIVVGFLAGVFLRSLLPLGFFFAAFLILLAIATVSLSFITNAKRSVSIIIAIALFAIAGGIVRMDSAVLEGDPVLSAHLESKVVLEGLVFEESDAREASTRIFLRADTLIEKGAMTSIRAGILLIAPAHAGVSYGDRIRAEGVLRFPESFETGGGREFDYPAFLAKDRITYELAFAQVEVMGTGAANPLKSIAISLKRAFLDGLGKVLSEPHGGLAGGITVGDKRGSGSELSGVFRTVGLIHIVVLSGYNIMIVMEGLSRFLGWFHASRYVRLATVVSVAVLFALMTGLASASVRAAAMAIIAVVGRMSGRMYLASRALALVASGMVFWNPFILVYDPGFQLSVLATAGLIAFTPLIVTRLRFLPTTLGFREIMATTIGTQIAVLPLLLYQSGQLPVFSLPANLLALAVVPWAMLFSAIAALGGMLLGSLGVIVALPAYVLLWYIVEIGNLFSSLPFSSVSLPAFSAWWLLVVYAIMFGGLYFKKRKRPALAPAAR